MNIAVEVTTAVVEILVLSIYLRGLYQTYVRNRIFIWVSYGIAWVTLCVFSLLPIPPIIRLCYGFLSFFVLAKLLFNAKWIYAFYSALLLSAIYIIADVVTGSLIVLFGVPLESLGVYGNSRILYIVSSKLVQFFAILLVIKLSKWKKSQGSLIETVPLLLCQVFSIFICDIMFVSALKAETVITWSFVVAAAGILYINIIVFLYVERIKAISEIKRQNELAELQYQSKVEYFNQVRDDQNETRALWHDIKKYLNTMNHLMSMNDVEHARECIEQVEELFSDIGKVVDVGNTVISAVLNHSIQKARRMGIDTELDVRVHPDLNVSSADLSVIIGNTFDNAVEACCKLTGEKHISIQLIQKGSMLFYEIRNPFDKDKPNVKENPKLHGFGLKNVQRCIDKYKGTMNVDSIDSDFVVSIHMNIPFESGGMQLVS